MARGKPEGYLPYIPSREDQLKALETVPEYDVLIIGGGCTGTGVALDAVSRGMIIGLITIERTAHLADNIPGLRTALVEMDDFGAGTSSRSTKLIHGGVRYLQKAILGLDREQVR